MVQNEVEITNELISKVLIDDQKAVLSFLKQIEPLVWGSLHTYDQLNIEEKEDLFQIIFIKLFEKNKRRIRMWKKKSKFTSYLYMIIANNILDYLKSAGRRHSQEYENIDNNTIFLTSENQIYSNEDLFSLKSSINKLNTNEREIISLFYFKQLKEREIAEKLSKPINTISSIKNRALKKLKNDLEES